MANHNVFKHYLFNLVQSEHLIVLDLFFIIAMNAVDLNELDEEGNALLHYAVDNEQVALVKLFLEYGADVNILGNERNTPLHFASINGHLDIMKLLIEEGALVNEMNDQRRTPLHLAAINGDQKIMKYLLDNGSDIKLGNEGAYTALHDVVNESNFGSVKFLIDHGALINAQNNEERYTPLHCAILNKDIKIIDLLLEKDADVYAKDKDGATALHLLIEGIVESADVDVAIQIMKRLLKAASLAIFEQQDNEGNKPLDRVVMHSDQNKHLNSGLLSTILCQDQIGSHVGLNAGFFNASTAQRKEAAEALEPPTKRLRI
jgi:ankyrin repeat protein